MQENVSRRKEILSAAGVASVTIFCLLPFVDKAYHIDDPLFLWTAVKILSDPFDFFGFHVNWYGWDMPMHQINKNPPGFSYFLAAVIGFFGFSEIAVHLSLLIPAVAVSVGVYFLAGRFCSRPILACVVSMITPAFLVSATNVMSDVTMLAFYVWAVWLWMYGCEKENSTALLGASLLISLAALTKYFGASLIPLLLAYSLVRRRRLGSWALYLLIPVGLLAAYHFLTQSLYGHSLLVDAFSYPSSTGLVSAGIPFLLKRLFTGLSFAGGCLIGVLFLAPFLWSSRQKISGIALVLISLFLILKTGIQGKELIQNENGIHWGFVAQYVLFVTGGIHIILLAGTDYWKNRDAASLMLLLWIVGTFSFASLINWTVNARTILPMAPAAGILVVRRLDTLYKAQPGSNQAFIFPLAAAVLLAFAVAAADFSWSNSSRWVAGNYSKLYGKLFANVWFQGHWGFQLYMESTGAKPYQEGNAELDKGDIVFKPVNNTNLFSLPKQGFQLVQNVEVGIFPWLATQRSELGAGFYTSLWGPLPYAIGPVSKERYEVYLAN